MVSLIRNKGARPSRTRVLGLGDNLAKELGKVWEVLAEEVGLEHEALAGVVGAQLTAEEFRLAGDAEGGALLGVLLSGYKLAHRAS